MATELSWERGERKARIANHFEKPDARGGSTDGMVVQISGPPPQGFHQGGFHQGHLDEAYAIGLRRGRQGY